MAEIKHHLSDAILLAYSAGTLPEAFSLVVAAHISMCDTCRAQMESFDALGGALVEDMDSVQLSDGSFEATMKLISEKAKDPIKVARRTNGIFPTPLQEYVGGDVDDVAWRPIGMGVKQMILPTSKDASARLLYIPSGAQMPDHGHEGTELTLVLQGAFEDEEDHFGVGDVEIATEDVHHTPIAVGPTDCICLAAADAKLKFNSLIPKIAQPFFRI
ncbi:MAG: ChrR family anti-sigma-E factor [Pseudomonadota bacterium]